MQKDHGHVHQNTSAARLFSGSFGEVSRVETEFADSDLGLGVLENLAGEVISLDGRSYAVPADGIPYVLQHDEGLAFAISARGGTHCELEIPAAELTQVSLLYLIDELIEQHHENPETIVATVRLNGFFSHVVLRTVSPPAFPDETLNTVISHELRYDVNHWEGTLVGFRFPDNHAAHADPAVEAVDGKIIAGLHLHGISDNRDSGGHVHEFSIEESRVHTLKLTVTLDELMALSASTNL